MEVRWEEAGGLDPTELLGASFQLLGAVLTSAGVDGKRAGGTSESSNVPAVEPR